ncbi:hypothetical protein A2686_01440 [Candidatus Woesebacteria bacterium RIFCSPHIGHO2_01_FULL_38_10]|uniref:Uncharacterized protein n=1 Tax=Candidatus Woesebacteria bacterium RIFCSPLOWO2_01_FULL_39_10b TaxID=1802517 RepID=A0A1F8B985_9BACT|nr:MAG: hypothetical protein A2686_01440 [Candidatus Woesebacteria bacterium RIFCSPHIGHO2_01_FULL_38_10]OGM59965.1 MAG: hypothetical protein A2892_03625 [Candidatus Woesebacteria bacterium RIFCSPLOWO2_01_FULL_39_10b]
MVVTPEIEKKSQIPSPEGVIKEVSRIPEVPPGIEGPSDIQATQMQPAQPVTDDATRVTTQSSVAGQTVQVPVTQSLLALWAKGDPGSSLTWFASFWLRMIKKAISFGKKIVFRR